MSTKLATDEQVKDIQALESEVGGEDLVQEALENAEALELEDLTREQASALIDELKVLQR